MDILWENNFKCSLSTGCALIKHVIPNIIERHNQFRSQFKKFRYRHQPRDPSFDIKSAYDLIECIAIEPIVARYIEDANFKQDNYHKRVTRVVHLLPDIHCGGPVVELLAHSTYLKQAGQDWKEYCAIIEQDHKKRSKYSQHAAAFLLTLLPNVKTLILPAHWQSLDTTNTLINAIVQRCGRSHHLSDSPSLTQITTFNAGPYIAPQGQEERMTLDSLKDFMDLPWMRFFVGSHYGSLRDMSMRVGSQGPYCHLGETIEAVHLSECCIDDIGIATFLSKTPRLRKLKYSHSIQRHGEPQDWNICKFVTAIARQAGDRLLELSVSLPTKWCCSNTPGRASMGGFRCLQKLKFPLRLAMSNLAAAECEVRVGPLASFESGFSRRFVTDLIPSSVSHLTLSSQRPGNHEKALELMFRHFVAKKDSQLPNLKEICLRYPSKADKPFKDECARLPKETRRGGVSLNLEPVRWWNPRFNFPESPEPVWTMPIWI